MADIVYQTQAINTPSIQTGTVAIAANSARRGFVIQNCATTTLYVLFGNAASTTVFHVALKGGTALDDGNGGIYNQTQGVVYTGVITVAGTPSATYIRYTATELAP